MASTDGDKALFSDSLIPESVLSALPDGYTIRSLRRSDYDLGFLDCLRVLTVVGDVSKDAWVERFEWMTQQDGYYIVVVEDTTKKLVVGTGAVVVEKKFIRELGSVGHIEDIAVAEDQQGKKLGLRIIQALDLLAKSIGCYKCILDCSEQNEGFYVKCGYKRAGVQMQHKYAEDK
jgi:glucosamine-phosphate N-acetyltransferase